MEYRQIVYIPPPNAAVASEDRENSTSRDANSDKRHPCNYNSGERHPCNYNSDERHPCNYNQFLFMWNMEWLLSQAVIQGTRIAKVEVASSDWEKKMGDAD